jgi:signal peptidase I
VTDEHSTSSGAPVVTAGATNGAGDAPERTAVDESATVVDGTKRSRRAKKGLNRTVIEWVVLVVAAIGIALLIKTFLFQAFYIPSESMRPTLNVGDRVLVNKMSYRLHDVNRGDIVVFETPPNAEDANGRIKDLVKRVIALPGETIETRDGVVHVNGRQLEEPYLRNGVKTCAPNSSPGTCADVEPTAIPSDHVFVMGDNRGASKDARSFGAIEESSIVGRVFVRIWPLNDLGFL